MMRFAMVLLSTMALVATVGCQAGGPRGADAAEARAMRDFEAWLSGSFSSAEQAAVDPNHFLDIRLHVVPIWTSRTDGPWLYVEQAAAVALKRPYRQRIYQLAPGEGDVLESRVFELPDDPLAFAGAWQTPEKFDALTPESLVARAGCTVYMAPRGENMLAGGTRGMDCASTLRGAAYATSEVTLTPTELRSWDRGYNAAGEQVWGATEGPYVFKRVTP